jgi:uncharacterized protein (DUF983 family)
METPMKQDEVNAHSAGLELPTPGRLFRLLGRGLRLRCPNCGKGPVLAHWLKLHVRCGTCGVRLERGEHDYFMGSMLLNFCLTGVLLLVGIATLILATKPDIDWDTLEWAAPLAMVTLPLLLFPFTKLLWLAADIAMRPLSAEELEWHRAAEAQFSTERDASR